MCIRDRIKSKRIVSEIFDKLGSDRVGIIAYASTAIPVLPITTDFSSARMFLESLNTDMLSSQGTSIGEAIRLSKNYNDDDLINTSYLNAPMWKYRLGVDYTPLSGINFAISFQHDNKFRSVQGFWNGMVETKNLIDASIGYRFSPKIRFDISATNLTDNKYRTYPNLPLIGRRVLGKLTVSL